LVRSFALKKWQVPATIVLLLAVFAGLNAVSDYRQQKAKETAKAAETARQAAEAKAAAAHAETHPVQSGPEAFSLPQDSGPATAPVKLEVFINNSNSCHQGNVGMLQEVTKTYGDLLRTEWFSMMKAEVSRRSDELNIGCEAGLLINGQIETKLERMGGKVLVSFRGTPGDKFKQQDIYLAINAALQQKGKVIPSAAKDKAKGAITATAAGH
jgi:type II secretory pathway pseudopilin PulG